WRSNLCQNILAEAAHIGDDGIGGIAVEAEIDGKHPKVTERAQIADDRGVVTRKQPAVAVIRLRRGRRPALGAAVTEADLLWVATGIGAMPVQPLDAAAEAVERVEPELRVGTDRVPGVAELSGTPQSRAAFAPDPDRHPLLYRARLEKDVGELDVLA